jgi:hypothetical protein
MVLACAKCPLFWLPMAKPQNGSFSSGLQKIALQTNVVPQFL